MRRDTKLEVAGCHSIRARIHDLIANQSPVCAVAGGVTSHRPKAREHRQNPTKPDLAVFELFQTNGTPLLL
jgi:hypothetical protein